MITTPPELTDFSLDLNASSLILTFSEIVMGSTLETNQITLSNAGFTSTYTLLSSLPVAENSPIITLPLSRQDGDAIKLNSSFGTSVVNTYINLPDEVITDLNRIPFNMLLVPRQAATVIQDNTPPTLEEYSLDMNTGILIMQFSEPISLASISIPSLTFYTAAGTNGSSVALDSSMIATSTDASSITIELSPSDLNNIKFHTDLAISENTTYLSLLYGAMADLGRNSINAIPAPGIELIAGNFVADQLGPELLTFTFDLNAGLLSITFDEVVDIFSTQQSSFVLLNEASGSQRVRLSGGRVISDNFTTLSITLTDSDLNAVKALRGLATEVDDTFIALDSTAISDVASNPAMVVSVMAPEVVSGFTNDTTQPELLQFKIEIDSGNITFTFSETVNVVETLNSTDLVVQSSPSLNPERSIRISAGAMIPTFDYNVVSIIISVDDIAQLFANQLCLNESECFLSFSPLFVADMSGNSIRSHLGSMAIQVNATIVDPNQPELAQFVLFDLNTGLMTLRFTKAVQPETLQPENITLSQDQLLTDSTQNYTLTGGQIFDSLGTTITLQLENVDLNAIKSNALLCSISFACNIRFPMGIITDLAGNPVTAEVYVASMHSYPMVLLPDVTGPQATNFDLDLDSNTLVVEFNEPIQSFTSEAITIRDGFNSTLNYTISFIRPSLMLSTLVTLSLRDVDINVIKATRGLADNASTTYFTYTMDIARDVGAGLSFLGGNAAQAAEDRISSIQVRSYTPDTTPPILIDFSILDLNLGVLTIIFDEPVDLSMINLDNLTLLSSMFAPNGILLSPEGAVYASADQTSIEIMLSFSDIEQVKTDTTLGTGVSNTYLEVNPGFISDTSGNSFNTTVMPRASFHQSDLTNPNLDQFNFDLDTGYLTLTFDDIIDSSSIEYAGFTFQNAEVSPLSMVQLSAGDSTGS